MRFNPVQVLEPSANITKMFLVMSQFFFLRCRFVNFYIQIRKFFFGKQSYCANLIFDILDGLICTRIQIVYGNGNFSINTVASQFFEDCSTFIFTAFQEPVEFALRKHHRFRKLSKVKPDDARHRRFDFRLFRERCFYVLRHLVCQHPGIFLEPVRFCRAMLVPTCRIYSSATFKSHLCKATLGTISHHLVRFTHNGTQARRFTVKSKANRIEYRRLSRACRARNAEHAAIRKIRRFKINRPFIRQGIDIAEFNFLNLHRSLLCVLVRLGDSFVKQTNKLVVLIFYNIIIYVFLSI